MNDLQRTKTDLLAELAQLRPKIARFEASESKRQGDGPLRASETLYRRLFEAAKDGILILDADTGEVTAVNPFLAELLGYAQEEILGQKLWEIGAFRDTATSRIAFRELQSREYIRYDDLPLETKDGRSIAVEFVSSVCVADHKRVIQCNIRDITGRKRTEAQLRLQGAALNAVANAVVITGATGLIEWVNPAFTELTGYSLEDAVGKNPRDLARSGEQDRAFYQNLLDTVLSGQVWRGEIVNRRKDGSLYTEEEAITPLRDPQGEIKHFIAVKQDITARKLAEVTRQHAHLSSLGAAVGLSLTDADSLAHALEKCAGALVTHLGVALARIWTFNEREGMLELQASAGLSTDVNGQERRVPLGQYKIGRIARDREPYLTNEVIGNPAVANQEWARHEGMVAFAGHPLVVNGRVAGVMALFARHALSDDVILALASVADHIALGIERHQGAEALRTAEERMRFALEAAGVGIWDMDYTTRVLRWSGILEAQYGLKPGEFGGTFEAFVGRIHPDDRAMVLDAMGKAMKTGADFSTQHRALWPDGSVRWLSGAGRIHLNDRGEPVRGLGISLDVTERRSLEEQYHQVQKMDAIGRLAVGVAHDFNNLLTVILGYSQLLLSDLNPTDSRRADIEEIHKAGSSAAGLTRQLLAFSRKEIIEPTLLDLNVVVTHVREMIGRLTGEDVKVVLALRPDLAAVKADRGQVEQIIMNLAANARDAMLKGGTLTIETANVELDEHYTKTHLGVEPGPYVVLTVTDTGSGMTPQVQARLFEPFFTTKGPGKGTGLGLATVYGIITRAGGSVGVYSEVGKGSSLKVYFPRAGVADLVAEAPVAGARQSTGTETVLIVEDSDALREVATRLLKQAGFTVLVAENADEAVRLVAEHPSIDIILTDVVMPGGSGPELVKRLAERRPALKAIFMSGYTEEAIVQHGVIKPGIAFLHKPFSAETLGQKIREVLDRP